MQSRCGFPWTRRAARLHLLDALHVVHAGDLAEAADDALQVAHVFDVNHHIDGRLRITGARFDVADVRAVVADDRRNLLEHAGTVLAEERELDGITLLARLVASPFDVNAAVHLVHQVLHVRAIARVHRYAFAARDVADDVFTANGI